MKTAAQNPRSGQAMLIAVLSLGGAILGATTIAGLLTLYQIRATTDTANSAKAIFAADAGVEWALFNHYCGAATPLRCSLAVAAGTAEYTKPVFANGAALTTSCYDSLDTSQPPVFCSVPAVAAAIANGTANGSDRAFYIGIANAMTTYP